MLSLSIFIASYSSTFTLVRLSLLQDAFINFNLCSGLGIIRRKPEIKYKEKEEFRDLPQIQKKILENASKYVKKGGTLIYSTCTIQDSENIDVINEFLQKNKKFELAPINEVKVDLDNQEKGYMKI